MFRYPNRCLLILINLFYRQMSILTMSIIAKCAFGMTIENLGEKDNPLLEKARDLFTPPQNKTFMGIIGCKGTKFRIYFRKIETYTSPILITVILHGKLLKWLVKSTYKYSPWQFFLELTDNMAKERSNSNQVFTL